MTDFAVTFDPPLRAARKRHDIESRWMTVYPAAEAAGLPELNPRLTVSGQVFAYYPAHVTTVLADMLGSAEVISKRMDGEISLSGYTVLLVEFRDSRVFFRNPSGLFSMGGTPVGEGCDPVEVEAAFRNAADAVWEWIFPRERRGR